MTDETVQGTTFSNLPYDIKDRVFQTHFSLETRPLRLQIEHRLQQIEDTQRRINRAYAMMMQGNNPEGQQNLINEFTERLMEHQDLVQTYNDRLARRQLTRQLLHRQFTQ
jgi:hypothetical protein